MKSATRSLIVGFCTGIMASAVGLGGAQWWAFVMAANVALVVQRPRS